MAKTFIDTLEEGLRKSRTVDKLDSDEFKKEQEKERRELSKKVEQFKEEKNKKKEYTLEEKEEMLNKIKNNMDKLDLVKMKEVLAKHEVSNLGDVSLIPDACLDEILALI